MGASEGSEGGIGAGECGVGTIVWVRRRNGSWWPGRILGQDELSASHLMSPRSGTPVKLLGREDASVDWYNLEKSKRVKSFRCGEFDSCIERAEASQGAPIKKREKYARREDAILHALELEKQMIEKRKQKFGSISANKYSGDIKREQNVAFSSGNHSKNNESANHGRFVPKSQLLSRKVGSSEAGINSPFHSQKGGKRSIWEAGTSETMPRMRGLQDFGLRSAQSKRKDDASVSNESTRKPFLVESHGRAFPGSMQGMEGIPNAIGSKNYLPLKKRRAQGNEEFLTKRRDRRRPLVQVLQSSAKLSASQSLPSNDDSISGNMQAEDDQAITLFNAERPTGDNLPDDSNTSLDHIGYSSDQMQISPVLLRCPGPLVEENTSSGFNEADDSDSVEEVCSDEDADTEDDGVLYQGYTQAMPSESKRIGRYMEDDSLIAFPDQDNDESFLSGYSYPQYHHRQTIGMPSDLGVSKWNMKGKRNIRNLTKRPMESMDEMPDHIYRRSMNGRSYESKRRTLKSSRGRVIRERFYQKYDSIYGSDFIEVDLSPQSARYRKHKFPSMPKGSSGYQRDGDINDSDEESPCMSPSGWEAEGDHFDQYYARHISGGMEWVDVDLKVQASYQGERVPLVSLMSRLNGKAIIGHPVQIETLDDGSTNQLIARNDSLEDRDSIEGNETPPTVWRTGRRTAMQRVPHPHPLPAALKNKVVDSFLYSDPEIKPTFKKPYAVHLDNQTGWTQKSINSHRAVRYQKKPSKKAILSNQKVRKLSSFATQQKLGRGQGVDGKLTGKDVSILDDLIKAGGSVPMVTCVPVKVACSRILEAVGRSPSTATTQRGLLPATSENKPS